MPTTASKVESRKYLRFKDKFCSRSMIHLDRCNPKCKVCRLYESWYLTHRIHPLSTFAKAGTNATEGRVGFKVQEQPTLKEYGLEVIKLLARSVFGKKRQLRRI